MSAGHVERLVRLASRVEEPLRSWHGQAQRRICAAGRTANQTPTTQFGRSREAYVARAKCCVSSRRSTEVGKLANAAKTCGTNRLHKPAGDFP